MLPPETNWGEYTLDQSSNVRLSVYHVTRKEVMVLVIQFQQTGKHAVKWNGQNNNGSKLKGLYFIKLQSGNKSTAKQLIVF